KSNAAPESSGKARSRSASLSRPNCISRLTASSTSYGERRGRMAEDREVSKGIVTNPRRLGGKPTIKGTRIPRAKAEADAARCRQTLEEHIDAERELRNLAIEH